MRRIALSVLVVGVVAVAAGGSTYAAFSDTTSSDGNVLVAGTVVIADNDGGAAMLSLANAQPGASTTGCIEVTYSGNLDAEVRLHGAVAGSLAPYLTLTVERDADPGAAFPSCSGFTPDATIYSGLVSDFPGSWGSGVADGLTWTTSDASAYRFTVTVANTTAIEGRTATADITWEARNL